MSNTRYYVVITKITAKGERTVVIETCLNEVFSNGVKRRFASVQHGNLKESYISNITWEEHKHE